MASHARVPLLGDEYRGSGRGIDRNASNATLQVSKPPPFRVRGEVLLHELSPAQVFNAGLSEEI